VAAQFLPTAMALSSNQPNTTLYINNLNDKINKEELKSQLFALFTTYGKIIDIVASKSQKMRGQAFLVFTDLAGATSAMRACEGMMFYDKPLVSNQINSRKSSYLTILQKKHVDYAKSKSYATLQREDPNFVPPTAANASSLVPQNAKRPRDSDTGDSDRHSKREKPDDSDEEMEIDDDEETPRTSDPCMSYDSDHVRYLFYTVRFIRIAAAPSSVPTQVQQPSLRLLCTNLPQEVTDDVLSVLLQQYDTSQIFLLHSLNISTRHKGFQKVHVTWSPALNSAGIRVKMAQVLFETPELATTAKDALDGFTLKKGWQMSVVYI